MIGDTISNRQIISNENNVTTKNENDIILEFRNQFGEYVKNYSDEKILKKLEENDFDFQKALTDLMLGTTLIFNK